MNPVETALSVTSFITPGGILDVTDIPTRLSGLGLLSKSIALTLLVFFGLLETVRQNASSLEGSTKYTSMFIRIIVILIALVGYRALFNFPIAVMTTIEDSVLRAPDYIDATDRLTKIALAKEDITFLSGISMITAWLASWLSRMLTGVVQSVQFIVLGVLYFMGPLVIAASIFEPLRNYFEVWMKAIVETMMWTLLIRILFRIMLDLGIFAALTQSDATVSLVQFTVVNMAFVVMIFLTPVMAHRFIGGPGFAAAGAVAATFITSRMASFAAGGVAGVAAAGSVGAAGAGTSAVGGAARVGGAIRSTVGSIVQTFSGTDGSKTAARDAREQMRLGDTGNSKGGSASDAVPPPRTRSDEKS